MLLRLNKYLQGYVKIAVTGYSPERFLNLCNVQKILLWGVENQKLTYQMYLSVKDYKRLRPLARKTGTRIVLLEKHGFPFFLYRFRKRKMFFAGMFLCVIFIYFLSLFIWNIHVEGNATQSTEEILEYLETLQIRHGTPKAEIVCETIETKLRSRYPNILWVSAEMRGTRILIQIKENTDTDILSKIEKKEKSPVSIVSERDGTVTSMIVRSGTPMTAQGEKVKAGQILVAGYYEIRNDADEILRYEKVPADADIIIQSEETYSDCFSVEYQQKQYTGKKRLGVRIRILDQTFQFLPKMAEHSYDIIKDLKQIHVTENFYLPISVEFQWFLQYEEKPGSYSEDQLKKQAETRFQKKYENILQKGVQIIEKDVRIVTNGKVCRAEGTVKLQIPVTAKIPVELPEENHNTSEEGEHSI